MLATNFTMSSYGASLRMKMEKTSTCPSAVAPVQGPEIDAATLQMLPDDSKEALLQRLLEQKLRKFAGQVRLSLQFSPVIPARHPCA